MQELLHSWTSFILDSSIIFYRAVGTYNKSILFGGKNSPFHKHDPRLRNFPFPTNRPSYNEIKRVYEILSTIELYGKKTIFCNYIMYNIILMKCINFECNNNYY